VGGVGAVEHSGSFLPGLLGGAVVDVGRSVQAQPAVVVFVVVPGEERAAEQAGGLDRAEPVGEVGPVLQRLDWASL
jgi:hypothetical protein